MLLECVAAGAGQLDGVADGDLAVRAMLRGRMLGFADRDHFR